VAVSSIAIDTVDSSRALSEFVDLPFRVYANDNDWAAPLKSDVRWMLDVSKNPFWKHAQRQLFLARREGKVVGRIAAIVDEEHNRVHAEKTGFFGFFESEDDREVAVALFRAAESAVAGMLPGVERVRGPVNPSLNDEAGALVPAESDPGVPFIMMTYNPAYYLDLFGAAGYAKVKDLVAILAPVDERSFERLRRVTDIVRKREKGRAVVRPIRMDRFDEDLSIVKDLYNRSWEKNWGFVPMTTEEMDFMAKRMKPLLVEELIWLAEAKRPDGTLEPIAFMLMLPDYNVAMKPLKGRLLPFGWLNFLLGTRNIKTVRVLTLGIKNPYRMSGIQSIMMADSLRFLLSKGYTGAEVSWLLEDNELVIGAVRLWGGQLYKTYRIYEKAL
jgi:hypothetical protein